MNQHIDERAKLASEIAEWHMKMTEKELVTAFIAIEGELPEPEDISKHSERFNDKVDGIAFDYFWWKGEHILSISQPRIPEPDERGVVKPWVQVDKVYEEKYGVADLSNFKEAGSSALSN